jgi:hypothetical protein
VNHGCSRPCDEGREYQGKSSKPISRLISPD